MQQKTLFYVPVFLCLFACEALSQNANQKTVNNAPAITNLVPDERTAVAIAITILTPIYGEDQIKSEQPFHATLRDKTWVVSGTLPKGYLGGVATIEISKDDARVSRIIHTQ